MIMEEHFFYICDRKQGACSGWKKGWAKCENEMCMHTSDIKHAKYKAVECRKFEAEKHADNETAFFEFVRACDHPEIMCSSQLYAAVGDIKLCTEKDCTAWQLRE